MKVTRAEYLKSALKPEDFPKDGRPEIAFVGRSNVGKSSLLNRLLNRKNLAKTSGTPGKTQTINFFDINEKCYFVDLPGYGYAKVPKTMKAAWNQHMRAYLINREPLIMAAVLLDCRRTPTENDVEIIDMLAEAEIPTLLVVTKIDKLKKSQRAHQLRTLQSTIGLDSQESLFPFSAVTGEGVNLLWGMIDNVLNDRHNFH